MKILLINKFLYPKGGDAISTLNTGRLLRLKGHKVLYWGMDHPLNREYSHKNFFVTYVDFNTSGAINKQIKMALNILYSLEAKRKVEKIVCAEKPDLVHLNNFAHQISPSIIHVFKKYNIPTVMTMHDYKLVCGSYTLLSKNGICELCKNGKFYNCLFECCVKDSRVKSFLNMVEMYLHHKILHIYDFIDIFIAPSMFLEMKLREMGFKGEVLYLPNFVNLDGCTPGNNGTEKDIVYFGRLSKEKGLFTLIDAMKGVKGVGLKIIGEGPIKEDLERKVEVFGCKNIRFLGYKTGEGLKNEVRKSVAVVVPSECFENNPLSVIEGFSLGKPAIGARIGGIPELAKDNETGLTFEPGSADDLRSKIEYLIERPEKIIEMGKNARDFVERHLSAERHYERLMEIYECAVRSRNDRLAQKDWPKRKEMV